MHPTNPQILYAGVSRKDPTGTGSPGVWKSVDGGQNWANVHANPFTGSTGNSTPADVRLAVTPAAPDSIYVFWGGSPAGAAPFKRASSRARTAGNGTNRGTTESIPPFRLHATSPSTPRIPTPSTSARATFTRLRTAHVVDDLTRNFLAPNFNYSPATRGAPRSAVVPFAPRAETFHRQRRRTLPLRNGGANSSRATLLLALAVRLIAAHAADPGVTYGVRRTTATSAGCRDEPVD